MESLNPIEDIYELDQTVLILIEDVNKSLLSQNPNSIFLNIEGIEDKSRKFISQPQRGIYKRDRKMIEVNIEDILAIELKDNIFQIETNSRYKAKEVRMLHKGNPLSIILFEKTEESDIKLLEFRRLVNYQYKKI